MRKHSGTGKIPATLLRSDAPIFDSNCITPGTEFMSHLSDALDFFVQYKLHSDSSWSAIEVIVSGPDVPGEGEHKIMDYIRRAKSQHGKIKVL